MKKLIKYSILGLLLEVQPSMVLAMEGTADPLLGDSTVTVDHQVEVIGSQTPLTEDAVDVQKETTPTSSPKSIDQSTQVSIFVPSRGRASEAIDYIAMVSKSKNTLDPFIDLYDTSEYGEYRRLVIQGNDVKAIIKVAFNYNKEGKFDKAMPFYKSTKT